MVSPAAAPQAWLAYAVQAPEHMAARLSADDPVVARLRNYLNQLTGADKAEGVTLRLSVWVGGKGAISRVALTPFAVAQPNDDLQALLVGLYLSAPPKGILLPMRLGVTIKPTHRSPRRLTVAPGHRRSCGCFHEGGEGWA